jgi:hypothetical protein
MNFTEYSPKDKNNNKRIKMKLIRFVKINNNNNYLLKNKN